MYVCSRVILERISNVLKESRLGENIILMEVFILSIWRRDVGHAFSLFT